MTSIFTNLWSASFAAGLVAGFLLSKLWCVIKTCWLNKHRPLPDGRRRSVWRAVSTDRRWLIGMVAAAFLIWSVFTTSENASSNERNASEAAAFAQRVQDCQARLIQAIIDSRKVTDENTRITGDNDRLSREERGLLADALRYQGEWIGKLLDPQDPAVKNRATTDPVRQQYNIDVTRGFFNRAGEITKRINAIHAEQDANDAARPAQRPALPDPSCGE